MKNYNPNPFSDPIKQLESKLALQQDALDHRLSKLNMKKAWQEGDADNVDATHPLVLNVYVPEETRLISKSYLRLKLQNFRTYGETAGASHWFTSTTPYTSGMEVTDSVGAHSHTVIGTTDVTSTSFNHNHIINADHRHDITHGIFESTSAAAGVTVEINSIDRTTSLGGPFNADQGSLNIQPYLSSTGWNTISLGSTSLGRIHATVFTEIYLP